jgi:hypothetical protein
VPEARAAAGSESGLISALGRRPGRKGKDVACVISSEVLAAGPLFFVSAWLLMIFAGIVATDVGIRPFGYITSMVVTIGLWLTLAPAIGAIARTRKKE